MSQLYPWLTQELLDKARDADACHAGLERGRAALALDQPLFLSDLSWLSLRGFMPPEALRHLVEIGDAVIAVNVAGNPSAPHDLLIELASVSENENYALVRSLVTNPKAPPEALRLIAEKSVCPQVLRGVALHQSTPLDTLRALSKREVNLWLLTGVADNTRTPPDVLAALGRSEIDPICWSVALNPSTPPCTLRRLLGRYGLQLAQNPSTPEDVLRSLGTVESSVILRHLCLNPSTPVEILEKISRGRDYEKRVCVARNPNAPQSTLFRLARSKSSLIRLCVAENPNCPPHLRQRIEKQLAAKESA